MSLTSYPFNDILTDLASFDRFFDGAFNSRQIRRSHAVDAFRPRMDVEIPGLQKEDVSIDVHNNVFTVSGQSNTSSERNDDGYLVRERRYGKFTRTLSLPQGIKDIKPSMTNGILNITFPKSTPEMEPTKVTIN